MMMITMMMTMMMMMMMVTIIITIRMTIMVTKVVIEMTTMMDYSLIFQLGQCRVSMVSWMKIPVNVCVLGCGQVRPAMYAQVLTSPHSITAVSWDRS